MPGGSGGAGCRRRHRSRSTASISMVMPTLLWRARSAILCTPERQRLGEARERELHDDQAGDDPVKDLRQGE